MRIGFSHYKPEKTSSSSTVVLPPFRRLRPSTSSPCTHPPPCSFSIFTSRAHSPPRPSLAFLPLVAAAVAWLRASCSSQLQLHISAQTEKKKKEGRRKRRTRRRVGSTGAVRRTSRNGDEIRVLGTSPIPTFLNSETDLCFCPVNYIEFS